jgi:hypothetical protein
MFYPLLDGSTGNAGQRTKMTLARVVALSMRGPFAAGALSGNAQAQDVFVRSRRAALVQRLMRAAPPTGSH